MAVARGVSALVENRDGRAPQAEELIVECQGLALALSMVGAMNPASRKPSGRESLSCFAMRSRKDPCALSKLPLGEVAGCDSLPAEPATA